MWLPRLISFSGYFQTSPIQYRTDMESVPHIKLANTFHSCHIAKKGSIIFCVGGKSRRFSITTFLVSTQKETHFGKFSRPKRHPTKGVSQWIIILENYSD